MDKNIWSFHHILHTNHHINLHSLCSSCLFIIIEDRFLRITHTWRAHSECAQRQLSALASALNVQLSALPRGRRSKMCTFQQIAEGRKDGQNNSEHNKSKNWKNEKRIFKRKKRKNSWFQKYYQQTKKSKQTADLYNDNNGEMKKNEICIPLWWYLDIFALGPILLIKI